MASPSKPRSSHLTWAVIILTAYLAGVQTGLISCNSVNTAESIHTISSAVSLSGPEKSYRLAFDQSYGFFDDINEYNWKLMQHRARTRINHKFNSPIKFYDEPARWYMNNFEPDFTCPQERRVNGPGDGPKW
jgi:hypothetical protein